MMLELFKNYKNIVIARYEAIFMQYRADRKVLNLHSPSASVEIASYLAMTLCFYLYKIKQLLHIKLN